MVATFTQSQGEMVRVHSDLVATLTLGWKDSVGSNNQPSTGSNANETSNEPEVTLADLPDPIRLAQMREETEDEERELMIFRDSLNQQPEHLS